MKIMGSLVAYSGLHLYVAFGSTLHGANLTVDVRARTVSIFATWRNVATARAYCGVQVLHRTLCAAASKRGGRLPRKVRIQLDNASDNKNRAVIAYCAFLVHHKLVGQVNISFLVVGHT